MVTWPVVPHLKPFRALRYDPGTVGPLDAVVSPPHDVVTPDRREALVTASPYNAVRLLNPESPEEAARLLDAWRAEGVLVREAEPAVWVLEETFPGIDGGTRTRRGLVARAELTPYSSGEVLPHERTFERQKDARLELLKAVRTKLSPIFLVHEGSSPLVPEREPDAEATLDGVTSRLWRASGEAIAEALGRVQGKFLIADGHHRYETARVYADEIGGEGDHRYVLMLLVALEDPGLLIFPTHRLLSGLRDDTEKQIAIRDTARRDFEIEELDDPRKLEPPPGNDHVAFGYMDSFFKRPFRFTLKDQGIADEALAGMPEPYRRLDTAVLEAIALKGALKMSDDDIDHKHGLDYSKNTPDAVDAVLTGRADAAFYMRGIPVEQVQEIAGAGESMPPKSTYFFPKIPTGLLFNALE